MDLDQSDIEQLDAIEMYEKVEWFIEAQKLTPGSTFGEIALIKDI